MGTAHHMPRGEVRVCSLSLWACPPVEEEGQGEGNLTSLFIYRRKTMKIIANFTLSAALTVTLLAPGFAAVPIDSATREIQAKTFFAINGTKVFHIPDQLDTTVQQRIEWMHQLGVAWDRTDWWWGVIEPEKGRFDFSIPDKCVANLESQGIQLLPILCYGAAWFPEGRNAPITDEEREAYANYVYETVKRYSKHFTYWEVWNEPNILPFWAPEPNVDDYAKLLKIVYQAAKRADPDCKICAPVVAPLGAFDRKFVERLYQLGCKDSFDVFDYHYYRNHPPEKEVPAELADIKALMHRYGDDKPIWISETGVSGPIKGQPESYNRQASLVVRNQLLCLASGVERIFYFDLQNWNDDLSSTWDAHLGMVEASGRRKPAFHAYRTLIAQVDLKRVLGVCPDLGKGVTGVLVYDPRSADYLLAVWTTDDSRREIEIACETKPVRVVYPYGDVEVIPQQEASGVQAERQTVMVTIDRHPRYVHSVDPDAYLARTLLKFAPERIEITPGDRQALALASDPLLGECKIRMLNVQVPKGLKWDAGSGQIEAMTDAAPGKRTISAKFEAEYAIQGQVRRVTLSRTAQVEIHPTLFVKLRPYLKAGKILALAAVENLSTKIYSGNLEFVEKDGEGEQVVAQRKVGKLAPGKRIEEAFPVDPEVLKELREPTVWKARFLETSSKPIQIQPFPLREDGPLVDGLLDEWETIPPVEIGKASQITRNVGEWTPENASAKVRLWFTREKFYFAADVTDNDPLVNDHEPVQIWRGDNLELYLGLGGPGKRTVIDKKIDFQIGFAPTCSEGRPIVFLFHEDRTLESARIVSRKTETGYRIEAEVPLAELGQVALKDGMALGFDLALDDLDSNDIALAGTDAGRQLMWNGTSQNWIDPSGWGLAVLMGE